MSLSRLLCLSLAAASAGLVAASSANATSVGGTCEPTQVRFSASDKDQSTTTSVDFVNLPQGSISFTQGGAGPSCVIVTFTGMAGVGATGALLVRALMDGNDVGLPNVFNFVGGSNNLAQTDTATFIFPSVAPGAHQMRIQFAGVAGQLVAVHRHNIVANFAP